MRKLAYLLALALAGCVAGAPAFAQTSGLPSRPRFQTVTTHTLNVGAGHVSTTSTSLANIRAGDSVYIFNSAVQQRTSTTTLADDANFVFTNMPVGTYILNSYLFWFDQNVGAAGTKYRWNGTVGTFSSGGYKVRALDSVFTNQQGSVNTTDTSGGAVSSSEFSEHLFVSVTTSAGTLALQWAQNTSGGAALQFRVGSWVRITRLN